MAYLSRPALCVKGRSLKSTAKPAPPFMAEPGYYTVSSVVSDLLGRPQRALIILSRLSNSPPYNFNYTQIYLKFYELQAVDIASQLHVA
jgi:hypothetical protein